MKKRILILVFFAILLLGTTTALAGSSYPWRDHAPPFDFLFGNHIDTHQQGKLTGNEDYRGFFYIKYTGTETIEGVPDATHENCANNPGNCIVGWRLKGVPVTAEYLGHPAGEHPSWCVDPTDLPKETGYSHFHWLNVSDHASGLTVGNAYDGYLIKLTAIDTFYFEHHGGFLVTPGLDIETHANVVTDCD